MSDYKILTDKDGNPIDATYPLHTQLSGSKTGDVVLADAVTTTGAKTPITVDGAGSLRANIYGTGAFSVKLQGVMYDGVSYTIPGTDIINNVDYTDITTAGIYEWDIAGFVTVNLYVTSVTTNVSCKGALLA